MNFWFPAPQVKTRGVRETGALMGYRGKHGLSSAIFYLPDELTVPPLFSSKSERKDRHQSQAQHLGDNQSFGKIKDNFKGQPHRLTFILSIEAKWLR